MAALLHPRNVALVGASPRPGMATTVLEALQRAGYPHPVYPVNPRYGDVAGLPCYPSLSALPERPDHVVVAVPAPNVVEVLREAVAAGAGSATIMSSGFEGNEPEVAARRDELQSLLRESGLAVSGPNCMGNFSAPARFMTMAEERVPIVDRGTVAVAGQSGGIVMAIYRSLWDRGIATEYALTTGDEIGLCSADYIEYFATCDGVNVIVYYAEGLAEPERFAAACRSATGAGKRVVIYKVGRSEGGREAALLHTGSLPGPLDAFDALIATTGAVRVDTLDEAVEAAEFLAHAAAPRGKRIGVIVFSGGLKAMVADCAERIGAELATLAEGTLATLSRQVGTGGSIGNPLDFGPPIGGWLERYLECLRAFRNDPNVDVVLVQDELLRGPGSSHKEAMFAGLDQMLAAEPGIPVALFSMISHSVTDYARDLRGRLPLLAFLQEPAKAIRAVDAIGSAGARYTTETKVKRT